MIQLILQYVEFCLLSLEVLLGLRLFRQRSLFDALLYFEFCLDLGKQIFKSFSLIRILRVFQLFFRPFDGRRQAFLLRLRLLEIGARFVDSPLHQCHGGFLALQTVEQNLTFLGCHRGSVQILPELADFSQQRQ